MIRYKATCWPALLLVGLFHLFVPPRPAVAQAQRVPGSPQLAYWTVPSTVGGRVFVVVHGGPGISHGYLRPELDRLTTWGEVVFYDQRGCGESSTASSYAPMDYAEDLHRVIETVRGDRKVVLVGSSFGLYVIGWYMRAHRDGVEGMILSGFGGESPDEVNRRLTSCPETNRLAWNAVRDKLPNDRLYTTAFRLEFRDRGGPPASTAPIIRGPRHMQVDLGDHDPWFSHPDAYFTAVAAFIEMMEGGTAR